MVLVGVVASGALVTTAGYMQANQFNSTIAEMDTIEKTLQMYAGGQNRVPCPANLTCTQTQLNYGVEGKTTGGSCGVGSGSCTVAGSAGANYFDANNNVAEGGVPTRTLRLADSYMYDAWGRKFRYAAYVPSTVQGSVPMADTHCGGVTVNDITGTPRTTQAIYAIVSHGQNGHGAYTHAGSIVNAGSLNTHELKNCHCTSTGAYSGSYDSMYYEEIPNLNNTLGALYNFDDLVTFKESYQLQTQTNPLKTNTSSCPYITALTLTSGNGPYGETPSTPNTLTFNVTYNVPVTVTGTPRLDLSAKPPAAASASAPLMQPMSPMRTAPTAPVPA